MAKIRTVRYKVYGSFVEFPITYSAKSRDFNITLPSDLEAYRQHTGQPSIYGETERLTITKLLEFIASYEAKKMKQRKVIGYRTNYSSKHIKAKYTESFGPRAGETSTEAFFSFEYKVLIERSVGKDKKFFLPEVVDFLGAELEQEARLEEDEFSFIEWTEELEEYFRLFYEDLEALIRKVNNCTDSNKKILAAADGGKRLGGNGEG